MVAAHTMFNERVVYNTKAASTCSRVEFWIAPHKEVALGEAAVHVHMDVRMLIVSGLRKNRTLDAPFYFRGVLMQGRVSDV